MLGEVLAFGCKVPQNKKKIKKEEEDNRHKNLSRRRLDIITENNIYNIPGGCLYHMGFCGAIRWSRSSEDLSRLALSKCSTIAAHASHLTPHAFGLARHASENLVTLMKILSCSTTM